MKTRLTAITVLVVATLVVPGVLYAQEPAPAAQPGDSIGEMVLKTGASEIVPIPVTAFLPETGGQGEAKVLEFAQSATVAPAQQGETRFDVVLTGVGAKLQVIKVVQELTGLGLKESRELVDNVPSIILRNVSQAEAEAAKVKLQAEGCTVEIKEKETSLFDVVLTGVGANRVQAIKVVQELTGLSLKQSKELVDNVPSIILRNGGISQAVDAKVKLQAEGCTVEIEETSFLMAIEDVSIKGRGTVVTGRVERGVVRVEDEVEIVGLRPDIRRTVVEGIEISREEVEAVTQAQAGDNVRLLLRGIDQRDAERGMVLAAPGSIKPHTEFLGEVYVLKEEEGGWHKAFFPGYRPQFSIRVATVTGEITLPVGVGMVMPGDIAYMTVKLVTPVALEPGWWFQVREGGRTVGVGIVSRIQE